MDLVSKVAAQPGATPVEGLPDVWHWSGVIFNFDAILTPDHRHLLEMRVMGSYDAALARAVLEFARNHSARITSSDQPLVPLEGFSCPGWEFDTVAAVSPGVHENHAQDDPDLHKATWTLFPGYRCEFSGTETEDEAVYLFRRALQPTKLDRDRVPFLRMRFANTRGKHGSVGPDRGLAPLPVLLNELQSLDGAPGSYVEWENRLGEVWQADYHTTLILHSPSGKSPEREVTPDELVALAERSVTHAGERG